MKKTILHFDSRNYESGSTNNEPKLKIDHPIAVKNGKIRLVGYNIPNSFHQVSASLGNNSFEFEEDDGNAEYTVTITSGWYTSTQLKAELETQIAALLATSTSVTISFNDINGTMTFTSDGVTDIKLNLSGNQGFADLIGFTAEDGSFANTQTGAYPINMTPVRYIYLQSSLVTMTQFGTSFHSSDGTEKIMYKIHTTGDYGDINILKDNVGNKFDYGFNGTIQKYNTFKFLDSWGNVVNFQNIPWNLEFEVEECLKK